MPVWGRKDLSRRQEQTLAGLGERNDRRRGARRWTAAELALHLRVPHSTVTQALQNLFLRRLARWEPCPHEPRTRLWWRVEDGAAGRGP